MVKVRLWVMCEEHPHKDRNRRVCVCVHVCVAVEMKENVSDRVRAAEETEKFGEDGGSEQQSNILDKIRSGSLEVVKVSRP